jgi:hypothetical protein
VGYGSTHLALAPITLSILVALGATGWLLGGDWLYVPTFVGFVFALVLVAGLSVMATREALKK